MEGDRTALARIITLLENDSLEALNIVSTVPPRASHIVGVTGPPGVGKSCLINGIISEYRRRKRTVGVIAIDPTSPLTGGAILGDRIRLQQHFNDPGVFIRSMGTRGGVGSIPISLPHVIRALEVFGRDVILVETAGAGQADTEIMNMVHTLLLVLMPSLGDDVQTMKAGLLEVSHIFIVNKADQPGADRAMHLLKGSLELAENRNWTPPIVKTIATTGEGVDKLVDVVEAHWRHLHDSGVLIKTPPKTTGEGMLLTTVTRLLLDRLRKEIEKGTFKDLTEAVGQNRLSVDEAAKRLLERFLKTTPAV